MISISNVLLGFVTRVQPRYLQSLLKVGQYWQYNNKPKRGELFEEEFLILSGGLTKKKDGKSHPFFMSSSCKHKTKNLIYAKALENKVQA
jgi:hypothetical protein